MLVAFDKGGVEPSNPLRGPDHVEIVAVDDPIDLTPLATPIRASSNFRFAWSFFRVTGSDLRSHGGVMAAFNDIVDCADCHSFLRDTLDDIYPREFSIERLHKHCSLTAAKGQFLDTLARAVNDRLGAYSRDLSASTSDERGAIESLFSRLGHFYAFTTAPGSQGDCEVCAHDNNHLFSNWFFGVAWDFTFFVTWPSAETLWMGCLSDTD
jgi:hypothetical protein